MFPVEPRKEEKAGEDKRESVVHSFSSQGCEVSTKMSVDERWL
jgi:hypothetical protein